MSYKVCKISRTAWNESFAKDAHLTCFGETLDHGVSRIDYALLCTTEGDVPAAYVTIKEMNANMIYWSYGGLFPDHQGKLKSSEVTQPLIDWCLSRYTAITFRVLNTNTAMLKCALNLGFIVTGTTHYKGEVYLEFTKERDGNAT